MSEQLKKKLEDATDAVKKLPPNEQEYLAGYIQGMADMAESIRPAVAGSKEE